MPPLLTPQLFLSLLCYKISALFHLYKPLPSFFSTESLGVCGGDFEDGKVSYHQER